MAQIQQNVDGSMIRFVIVGSFCFSEPCRIISFILFIFPFDVFLYTFEKITIYLKSSCMQNMSATLEELRELYHASKHGDVGARVALRHAAVNSIKKKLRTNLYIRNVEIEPFLATYIDSKGARGYNKEQDALFGTEELKQTMKQYHEDLHEMILLAREGGWNKDCRSPAALDEAPSAVEPSMEIEKNPDPAVIDLTKE